MGLLHFAVTAFAITASTRSLSFAYSVDSDVFVTTLTKFFFTCPCESTTSISFGTSYPTSPANPSQNGQPGDQVVSTTPTNGYASYTGTFSIGPFSQSTLTTAWTASTTVSSSNLSANTTSVTQYGSDGTTSVNGLSTITSGIPSTPTADPTGAATTSADSSDPTSISTTGSTTNSSTTSSANTSTPSTGQPFSMQVIVGGTKQKRAVLAVGFSDGELVLVDSEIDAIAFVLTNDGVLEIFNTGLVVGFSGGDGTSPLVIYPSVSALPAPLTWSIVAGALSLPQAGFCTTISNVLSVSSGNSTDPNCSPVAPVADAAPASYNTALASNVTASPQTTSNSTATASSSISTTKASTTPTSTPASTPADDGPSFASCDPNTNDGCISGCEYCVVPTTATGSHQSCNSQMYCSGCTTDSDCSSFGSDYFCGTYSTCGHNLEYLGNACAKADPLVCVNNSTLASITGSNTASTGTATSAPTSVSSSPTASTAASSTTADSTATNSAAATTANSTSSAPPPCYTTVVPETCTDGVYYTGGVYVQARCGLVVSGQTANSSEDASYGSRECLEIATEIVLPQFGCTQYAPDAPPSTDGQCYGFNKPNPTLVPGNGDTYVFLGFSYSCPSNATATSNSNTTAAANPSASNSTNSSNTTATTSNSTTSSNATATTSTVTTTTSAACTITPVGNITAVRDSSPVTYTNFFTGCGVALLQHTFVYTMPASENYSFANASSQCIQQAVDHNATTVGFTQDDTENWYCVGAPAGPANASLFVTFPGMQYSWGFTIAQSAQPACVNALLPDATSSNGTTFTNFYANCSTSLQGNLKLGLPDLPRQVELVFDAGTDGNHGGWTISTAVNDCATQALENGGTMFEFFTVSDGTWYCVAVVDTPASSSSFYPDPNVLQVWGFALSSPSCTPSAIPTATTNNGTVLNEFYYGCGISLQGNTPGGIGYMKQTYETNFPPDTDESYGGWTFDEALAQCVTAATEAGSTVIEWFETADTPPTWYCVGVNDRPADASSFYPDATVGNLWAFETNKTSTN